MGGREVVLGFRPHTYWTAVVSLAGDVEAPEVVHRARIDFAEGETRLVYHRAAEMTLDAAAAWVEHVEVRTREVATAEIARLVQTLKTAGQDARRAMVPRGGGRAPERLEDIVRSHSGQHAAEGEFYRDVVARACEAAGLEVSRVVERELPSLVGDALGEDVARVEARLKAMGSVLGPPWSEDQRLAALAAWLGLSA